MICSQKAVKLYATEDFSKNSVMDHYIFACLPIHVLGILGIKGPAVT